MSLTEEERRRARDLLGREPNAVESGMFSAMWSEHCSYKSSKPHLKKFPTAGPHVVQGPGENAGVVDIGDGWVAAFKIESHNHPSFIEPYQGAATGVGGILRDIFTMGARPAALLDSLRFGPLSDAKNRYLLEEVVAGIAGYGNCVGVPTIGGEIAVDEIYQFNPLVNVFCLGVGRRERLVRAEASGIGNPVIYIGSRTGRDGIHGATMASKGFDDEAQQQRPTVQVGDPFTEKLLLEACLDLGEKGLLIGIQDMGAAGLTSSASEMAGRSGTGIELHLDRVPLREEGMTPYEIMLSESQERMLLVTPAGREPEVEAICRKWDVEAAVVGRVTGDGRIRVIKDGAVAADLPVAALTTDAPVYERPMKIPSYLDGLQQVNLSLLREPADYNRTLLDLLGSPTICSKRWVYRQYDHMVRTDTVVLPGSDAAVIRVKETGIALAMSVDGNGLYCLLNPYTGGAIAVAEAARNVSCAGGRPLALTNCLNFGNPEHPEVVWQLSMVTEGMADACRALGIPVVSGNVSLYNETNGLDIYPTPVVGVVGLIEGTASLPRSFFTQEGALIGLLGETKEELGGSQYLKEVHHLEAGIPPVLDLEREAAVQAVCREAARNGYLHSAHDCSEGGLATALAESSIRPDETVLGADIRLTPPGIRTDALLFGESQSRIVISFGEDRLGVIRALADRQGIPFSVIGRVGGKRWRLSIQDPDGKNRLLIDQDPQALAEAWRTALEKSLQTREAAP